MDNESKKEALYLVLILVIVGCTIYGISKRPERIIENMLNTNFNRRVESKYIDYDNHAVQKLVFTSKKGKGIYPMI